MNKNVSHNERTISALVGAAALGLGWLSPDRPARYALAAAGGMLLFRGLTGTCHVYRALGLSSAQAGMTMLPTGSVKVRKSITINRTPQEIYDFWRKLENLPQFMKHLVAVREVDHFRSQWAARSPLGGVVEWGAEIVEDRPEQRIAWRSLPDSDIPNRGFVQFQSAPRNQGTELLVELEYDVPGGAAGAAVARLLGEEPELQMEEDLRRLKQLLETGELATVEGQTSGREARR